MNLSTLRTLVEVARVGSFALAADRLGLTLSAVSSQLKSLEQELDVSLFDRSFRPPRMTPEGRRILTHARTILTEMQEIRSIGEPDDAIKGSYRIGIIPTAMVRLLPQFLIASSRRYPAAKFAIESGSTAELVQRLILGELDIALLTETLSKTEGLAFEALIDERFVLAVPKQAKRWSLDRCARDLNHVRLAKPASGIDQLVTHKLSELDIICHATQLVDSVEAAIECVNAGIAFSILPEPDVHRYATTAVARRVPELNFIRRIGLATREDSWMRRKIPAIAELFTSHTK
jgi:DNA-binding transcriptional LysR family regulator